MQDRSVRNQCGRWGKLLAATDAHAVQVCAKLAVLVLDEKLAILAYDYCVVARYARVRDANVFIRLAANCDRQVLRLKYGFLAPLTTDTHGKNRRRVRKGNTCRTHGHGHLNVRKTITRVNAQA